jgi:hypothetical protein
MWCVPELNAEYVARMEDVLTLYEMPYNAREPVVCLDERPVQLRDAARQGRPARPGKERREDYEYVRRGTANVFCAVQPLGGRHFTKATENRSGAEFAKMVAEIVRHYPRARTIHMVLDNLSTHFRKALTDHLGPKRGANLWNRLTVHYTPKHGSWLNQAETEISLYSRGCLGSERVPTLAELQKRTAAWDAQMNEDRVCIQWGFTVAKARAKFRYRRSHFRRSED